MLQPIDKGHLNGCLLLASALLSLIAFDSATAQTTVFTYQGKLSDNGNPVSGQYDFQFRLFDTAAVGTGTQQGSTIDSPNVSVTAGNFTVHLDFGAAVFPGAERFLEISVRPAGGGAFTMLAPRHAVTSTPYALRSTTAGTAETATNATQLGGLTSGGFIQNTSTQQTATNFNIGGTGTANILSAATQFNLGGVRMFAGSGPFNDFATINLALTNTFVGEGAGINTLPDPSLGLNPGKFNTFVGANAGRANTSATQNAFFGAFSGQATTQGFRNAFFGSFAGNSNTTGNFNSYFGQAAGFNSTTAFNNAFFGSGSGVQNTTGDNNAFFGVSAGDSNTTGFGNTIVGAQADVGSDNLTNATAIGFQAQVTQSNSLVLGRVNTNVGIGTTAPQTRLHISGDAEGIRIQGQAVGNPNGAYLSFADAAGSQLGYVGDGSSSDNSMYLTSYVANVNLYTQIGAALTATPTGTVIIPGGQGVTSFPALEVAPSQIGGSVIANNLYIRQFNELASLAHVCWRVSNAGVPALVLTNCTSSSSPSRAKTEIQEFSDGLDVINRLKPVAFKWKEGGQSDFGLNAEDVAEVEPLLVARNAKGEVVDVKHDNLMVVFINAFKQQQSQIKNLQQEVETLMKRQQELDELKALVCVDRPNASACKSN